MNDAYWIAKFDRVDAENVALKARLKRLEKAAEETVRLLDIWDEEVGKIVGRQPKIRWAKDDLRAALDAGKEKP